MNAVTFGVAVLLVVFLPLALYIAFEDVLDFVEQDVLPLFRD